MNPAASLASAALAPFAFQASCKARLGASRCGTPQPTLEVRLPRGAHFRQLHTVLHLLAAAVEQATPARERWLVQLEGHDTLGYVYLELIDGSDAEARRGLALLQTLVSSLAPAAPSPPAPVAPAS